MHINILKELIKCKSITPNSDGAIEYLADLLTKNGFKTEIKKFGDSHPVVTNLYAVYGDSNPNICFAGHIDVVPPGDINLWHTNPFAANIIEDKIYGRGTVDMKGAIACFLAATLKLVKNNKKLKGSISFLITSDEEGEARYGTKEMLKYIYAQNHLIDFAIVGEPTNEQEIGDTIKIGRRGSINFHLILEGIGGHVAYPEKANNPLPCLAKIMHDLISLNLDAGSKFFSKSNIAITSIDVGNNTSNVIPANAAIKFNIRFNDLHKSYELVNLIEKIIQKYCTEYQIIYKLNSRSSSESFIQKLTDIMIDFAEIVKEVTTVQPNFSTSGGTSDARFIKNYCPVVEFGLLSATAHKANEFTKITDLQKLHNVYYKFLEKLLL